MSPDERSLLRHSGGQRTRPASSGSSQSDCDLTALQRCKQHVSAKVSYSALCIQLGFVVESAKEPDCSAFKFLMLIGHCVGP